METEFNDTQTKAIEQLNDAMMACARAGISAEDETDMYAYTMACLQSVTNGFVFHLGMAMKLTNDGWDQTLFSGLGQAIKDQVTHNMDETNRKMYIQKCQFCDKLDQCQDAAAKSGKTLCR